VPQSPRKPTYDELVKMIEAQQRRIAELERLVEQLRRKGKRQSAPFSKGTRKAEPKKPGRKPGGAYGRQATRAVPAKVDRHVVVQCPLFCPKCDGPVRVTGRAEQYQTDLPRVKPVTTCFEVHFGHCTVCGKYVQGRDRRQRSDALKVGRVVLGPGVIGTAAHLNKVGGLSYGKTASVLGRMFGISVSRSGLARALLGLGRRGEPSYEAVKSQLRASPVVYPDETGWRINGESAWMHVATDGRATTVYAIEKGRGYQEAASLLGEDYPGTIGSDGWAPYRKFEKATRQACLGHLLRRCKEMLETATGRAVRFPRAVKEILKLAFVIRDARDARTLGPSEVQTAATKLDLEVGRLLVGVYSDEANRRLAKHLETLRGDLFTFLLCPGLEGTNWAAETELRYAVVNRKTCGGGNRTRSGATAQAILMTLSRTATRRGHDDVALFADLLRVPKPIVHPLLAAN
jgi:transposase